jgi:hypothetical protein
MPRDDSVWLDDDERGSPLGPDVTEPCPEEPIRGGQLRSLHRTLKDAQLVSERQEFELQRRAAAERQHEDREDGRRTRTGVRIDEGRTTPSVSIRSSFAGTTAHARFAQVVVRSRESGV